MTWNGGTPLEEHYSAVTLTGIDQTTPLGDTSTNTSTSDPIQVASALNVDVGDVVLVASTSGNAGSYTPDTGYTEGIDTSDWTSTMATSYRVMTTSGTQQPSMDFDGTVNRRTLDQPSCAFHHRLGHFQTAYTYITMPRLNVPQ